jgi:hypothetical protein
MDACEFNEIRTNEKLRKRLAKLMALRCFRNTSLEDLHAGKVPHSQTGDFSDVVVTDAERQIPWNELSRLNDREMKRLMIDVVDHCYDFLSTLSDDDARTQLIEDLLQNDPLPQWHDPVGWKARREGTTDNRRPAD